MAHCFRWKIILPSTKRLGIDSSEHTLYERDAERVWLAALNVKKNGDPELTAAAFRGCVPTHVSGRGPRPSPARKCRFCCLRDVSRTVETPVLLAVFVEVEPEQPSNPSMSQIRK
jgi:hypothetical protein